MGSEITFKDNREDSTDDISAAKLQYLPFKIEYDGKANVQSLFQSAVISESGETKGEKKASTIFQNQFRGRPINGTEIRIPCNYAGIVLTELKPSLQVQSDADTKKSLSLTSNFDSLTYWNWDQPPTAMDPPCKLMDMLEISQLIHAHIDPDSEG